MENKVCSKCKDVKPLSLYGKDKRRKDGLRSECNECRKLDSKKYREENPEKRKETKKKWVEKNRDNYNTYSRVWKKINLKTTSYFV